MKAGRSLRSLSASAAATSEALLRRVHAALPRGGSVLLAEMLLHDDGAGPESAVLQDLNMLVQTEGRERSARGYAALLGRCGFANVEARRCEGYLDAVIAEKT